MHPQSVQIGMGRGRWVKWMEDARKERNGVCVSVCNFLWRGMIEGGSLLVWKVFGYTSQNLIYQAVWTFKELKAKIVFASIGV